jgi:hypothetical protein
MNNNIIILIVFGVLLLLVLYSLMQREQLCVKRDFGYITSIPVSNYVDANMALVHSTSLGQAPLGDPRYWLPDRSPITQSQWGLYQDKPLPLSETQPFDRSRLIEASKMMPVYTEPKLPPQCKPLN